MAKKTVLQKIAKSQNLEELRDILAKMESTEDAVMEAVARRLTELGL